VWWQPLLIGFFAGAILFGRAYRGDRGRYTARAQESGEHFEQRLFFDWLKRHSHPAAQHTFAIPNGAIGANREKRKFFSQEGVRKGVPDIMIAWPRPHPTIPGAFEKPGGFIEAKYGENTTSPEQDEWLQKLILAGYECYVCYSFLELKKAFTDYVYGDGSLALEVE
jgi:hypothetical protein